ncbi:MAG: hypothetical protein HY701_14740 [Gemmatimonadetes bacterium]|nr:hypothetical protein [Gemmatimonadota bacterium]
MKRLAARCVVLAGVTSLLADCFSYIPAELGTVPEGQAVRVYLDREALIDLTDLGELDGPYVSGTLLRKSGDRFVVRVPVTARREGFHLQSLGQDVVIRADQTVQLERRELNRFGTGLVMVGSTAVAGGVILLIMDNARAGERLPGGDDPEMRIRLFSIPLR